MTARATAVAEVIRSALDAADRLDPAERDPLYAAPSDPAAIRDPRGR